MAERRISGSGCILSLGQLDGDHAKIHTHYGFGGQPDAWGNKSSCVVPLVIGGVMWLMMWGIEQVPMIWNTGVTVTEENRGRVYRILKNLRVTIRLVVAAIFAWMTVCSARSQPLGSWFMPLTMLLVFGPIVLCLVQLYRKR